MKLMKAFLDIYDIVEEQIITKLREMESELSEYKTLAEKRQEIITDFKLTEKQNEEILRLARIGKAIEQATEKGVAWVYVDSTKESICPYKEEIEGLVIWFDEQENSND